jgi:creatinine amidohydrolase/Fe(II)-dependent formamide hydrolase-like protein
VSGAVQRRNGSLQEIIMKHVIRRSLAAASAVCCLAFAVASLAAEPGARPPKDPRSAGGGNCAKNAYNCIDTPNPLPHFDSVWLEELTWMDVRDAMNAGSKTIILPTGGVEPNGPWLALGKHDYVLKSTCEAIARKLGNALCAPIIPFVPEGDIATRSGHMDTVGTITVREEIYEGIITDVARSMKHHGFENIVLISDNGGPMGAGMKSVAEQLNKEWGATNVLYIPEYYQSWEGADAIMLKKGINKEGVRDGLHDDSSSTTIMMVTDPTTVRWQQRVKAGKATIDGVSIADRKRAIQWGKDLVDYRATVTVDSIRKAIEAKGKAQ